MELSQAARLWVSASVLRLFRLDRGEDFLRGCRQRGDAHAHSLWIALTIAAVVISRPD
jgi:hypothetical protein